MITTIPETMEFFIYKIECLNLHISCVTFFFTIFLCMYMYICMNQRIIVIIATIMLSSYETSFFSFLRTESQLLDGLINLMIEITITFKIRSN